MAVNRLWSSVCYLLDLLMGNSRVMVYEVRSGLSATQCGSAF